MKDAVRPAVLSEPRLVSPAADESDLEALESAFAGPLRDATFAAREQLRRIARYHAPSVDIDFPKKKLAAVLVLLHLNPLGELSVTLTTRSKRLRSHPGETALPGGRWEEGDGEGGCWTALREAHEEIGLPLPSRGDDSLRTANVATTPSSHLLYLTSLPPYTSRTLLVVLPVVYLLLSPASEASTSYLPSVLKSNPDEVDAVFHLPLRAFLMLPPAAQPLARVDVDASIAQRPAEAPQPAAGAAQVATVPSEPVQRASPSSRPPPSPPTASSPSPSKRARTRSANSQPPSPGTELLTHTFQDFTWLLSRPYRLHQFSHPVRGVTPSAVTGLTADIVIEVALLGEYGPGHGVGEQGEDARIGFRRFAEGQMRWEETIRVALGMNGQQGLGGKVGDGANGADGEQQ
ncbi:hypothetical protein Rhopal_006729-T1 [Rhodotorula paludigena]|uniref:Nudix hydrolase domain-containing protein n=1 Tax=Rhodotorula paludigena TaxID=86838 RepID=A0AAV5GWG9_9BASI|nr:hypothetical protein Rhopal_006729-T1 [Rhodotorula paludigena]